MVIVEIFWLKSLLSVFTFQGVKDNTSLSVFDYPQILSYTNHMAVRSESIGSSATEGARLQPVVIGKAEQDTAGRISAISMDRLTPSYVTLAELARGR